MGPIAFVLDGRLSRERYQILNRVVAGLKRTMQVDVLSSDLSEEEVLKQLQTRPYQLVLAPWYRYTVWSKIEAFFGLTRTQGPTFAGYISEPIQPYELGENHDALRCILLDFAQMSLSETLTLIQTLANENHRSGIGPLLEGKALLYSDTWNSGQSMGPKLDAILSIPEISQQENGWRKRLNAIRICFCALWSLIYEEGPGKSDLSSVSALRAPRAIFHVGADSRGFYLKILYTFASTNPRAILQQFWPDPKRPSDPAQLLLRHSDFVRVHACPENSDIEITVGLLPSAASESTPNGVHTLWIEPLNLRLLAEREVQSGKPLLIVAGETLSPGSAAGSGGQTLAATLAQNRFVQDAAQKIKDLKNLLTNREELIQELRSGGVGTAAPLPPPDTEALLEAFQERYFETRYQIRNFEIEIQLMERNGATPQEIEALRQKMLTLTQRENLWIKKITVTLEAYRQAKKKGSGPA
jgi:hypothetical protein